MKEQDILFKVRSELKAAMPTMVPVRTRGGDRDARPPLCLLDWETTRVAENGHNAYGGVVRDPVTGNAIGRELHRYHRMELDVTIRAYDESDRDRWLSDVVDHFLLFEDAAAEFHDDTTEWEVGDAAPRSIPVIEPDWYEGGVSIEFTYVSRVAQSADTLTDVQDGPNGGVYIDDL